MMPSKRVLPWLAGSLLIAAASFLGPQLYPFDPILEVSLFLSLAWLAILIRTLFEEKKQGLWLLIGAPLALFVPVALFLWVRACHANISACP